MNRTEKKILVVENDRLLLNTIGSLLELSGYFVTEVAGVEDARISLESHQYDLVISDYSLEGTTNGLEFIVELFQQKIITRGVLISGSYRDVEIEHPYRSAIVFLAKPFTRAQLIETIETQSTG